MITGTMLHHKYFNGVIGDETSEKYKSLALEHFKSFGMYGTGIFGMIAKGPNAESDYEWRNTDLMIAFANTNGCKIHYNTVITGHLDSFPDWYKNLSAKSKLMALENHVRAVVRRYKGKVSFFKLVNEVVKEPGENYLGTDRNKTELIANIFKWAVEESPNDRYMINEYGCIIRKEIRDSFINLIGDITKLGARIDIIGEQAHSGYFPNFFQIPPYDMIDNALEEMYLKTHKPIMITEFDLSPKNGNYEGGSINPQSPITSEGIEYVNWYEYQAYAYKSFKEICENKKYIEALYYWSFVDDPSLTWERPESGIFDMNFMSKGIIEGLELMK